MEQNRCPGCMEIKSGGAVCGHCGFDPRKQNAPHQLQIGTALQDRYLVGRALGQGGFGITYLGRNRYLERKVAIKEYYPSVFVDRNTAYHTGVSCRTEQMEVFFAQNRMRFLREAKTLAKLEQVPQIVSILDFFEANNTAYIVMEYLRGDDLRSYLRKKGGRMTPEETFRILRPVMAALVQVHEAGLVHRDISPDNIMLQYDGSVKLMDFGAVRSVEHPGVEKELTEATQAIVKHGFAPIEQYSAKGSIGPWTDEYALCATMYYCMTGKVPENVHDRIMGTDLVWDGIEGLTAQQKKILQKGMAIHAKDRYPSIRELMDALFPRFNQPAAGQETEKRPAAKQKETTGKRKKFALIGAAVLAAAVLLLMMPNGWKEKDGDYFYYRMGTKSTGWWNIKGCYYRFDEYGKMLTGWQEIDDCYYYFDTADNYGAMVTGWKNIDSGRYCFDEYGKMLTGLQEIDGNRYYFGKDGIMVTGWKWIGSGRYYFDKETGVMLMGWQEIKGTTFFFEGDGGAVVGWRTIDGSTYYFELGGAMVTDWRLIDNDMYYFDDNGVMATGWRKIGEHTYYFSKNGAAVRMGTHIIQEGNQYRYYTFDYWGRLIG